jgi:hypothetical protein
MIVFFYTFVYVWLIVSLNQNCYQVQVLTLMYVYNLETQICDKNMKYVSQKEQLCIHYCL